jgi:hypothetical protein
MVRVACIRRRSLVGCAERLARRASRPAPPSSLAVPTSRRIRPSAAALLLAVVGGGCSRGESSPAPRTSDTAVGRATDRSLARGDRVATDGAVPPPGVRPTAPAYRADSIAGAGSVAGTVVLDGPAPADSAVTPSDADRRACGTTVADRALDADGTGVRGAVVWLEGVGTGKPMPLARRYELAVTGCRLEPRHLPVAVGGTLHVHGVDPLASRLRFARIAAAPGDTAAGRVLLRTSMSAAGQVVPDARVIDAAGAVEVREEARPWMRAWVLAFDHPYFAATERGGAFTLRDVPPGTYRLVAWHERLGRVTAPVTVTPGQAAAVTVHMRAPATPVAASASASVAAPPAAAPR